MAELQGMRPTFPVANIEEGMAFYADLFGFRVERVMEAGALLRSGGAELALVLRQTSEPTQGYLYVSGVDELHDKAVAAGLTITDELSNKPWGLRDFVVVDPFGNQVSVGEWIS